jgi:hypothetical protein
VIVRYAATLVGLTNFSDYLVLGDDVVIANKEVATCYQKVIESIGVSISMHKSIVPSELQGLEFASKLINKDGNLSPLPIVLLTKPGIVAKLQFFGEVILRLVGGNVAEGPDLQCLLVAIFGKQLADDLGGLAVSYILFSHYRKISVQQLQCGNLPEFFQRLARASGISLVEDLLICNSIVKLSTIESVLRKLEAEKLKTFHNMSKTLIKAIMRDTTSLIRAQINLLGGDQTYTRTEKAQLTVLLSQ